MAKRKQRIAKAALASWLAAVEEARETRRQEERRLQSLAACRIGLLHRPPAKQRPSLTPPARPKPSGECFLATYSNALRLDAPEHMTSIKLCCWLACLTASCAQKKKRRDPDFQDGDIASPMGLSLRLAAALGQGLMHSNPGLRQLFFKLLLLRTPAHLSDSAGIPAAWLQRVRVLWHTPGGTS